MFDNPFIWIVLIWWLLTTFLGVGKKKKRVIQPAPVATEPDPENFFVNDPEAQLTGEYAEEYVGEPEPQPVPPVQPQPMGELTRMWRAFGREVSARLDPTAPAPEAEPVAPVEPVKVPTAPEPRAVRVTARPAKIHSHAMAPGHHHPRSPGHRLVARISGRYTPIQQAMIFREILERPRSRRRRWMAG